jgi:hypothetical protein
MDKRLEFLKKVCDGQKQDRNLNENIIMDILEEE